MHPEASWRMSSLACCSLLVAGALTLVQGCATPAGKPATTAGEAQVEAAPVPPPELSAERIAAGDWSGAAQAYLARAESSADSARTLALLGAAQAFALAGDLAQAEASLAKLPVTLDAPAERWRVLIRDVLANSPVDTSQPPDPSGLPELARSLQQLRFARAALAAGRWQEGLSASTLITGLSPDLQAEALDLAWRSARRLTELPSLGDPIAEGWRRLAVTVRNPGLAPSASVDAWSVEFPEHPAQGLLPNLRAELSSLERPPGRIALLLPAEGRYLQAAEAVRDGFIAAWMEDSLPTQRPTVVFLPYQAGQLAAAYGAAESAGADLVVGPLEREAVAELLAIENPGIPTLALNVAEPSPLGVPQASNGRVLQFGLLPEREAVQAADYASTTPQRSAVALVPEGIWGDRVLKAFKERLDQQGGRLLRSATYRESEADFQGLVRRLLDLPSRSSDDSPYPAAEGTELPGVLFVAGRSREVRQILPYLRYFGVGGVTRVTTSQSYTGAVAPDADLDLDGTLMTELPWLLGETGSVSPTLATASAAWPGRQAQAWRLFAFGMDAYRLAMHYGDLTLGRLTVLSGATGSLTVGEGDVIENLWSWSVFRAGRPNLISNSP